MTGILVKPLNTILTGFSFLHGSITGKAVPFSMPCSISAELTNQCNLLCPECASGSGMMTRPRGYMDKDLFRKLTDELRPYLNNINLFFQGEPMLHPGLPDFIKLASGIKTTLSTNGHFLTEENSFKIVRSGLDKIIISLDGMDQTTYSEYRRSGDFDRVISGIYNVKRAKAEFNSNLTVEIQFLVNRYNESQIDEARRFAGETGVKLRLKSMQVVDYADAEKWMPSSRKYRRYIRKDGEYRIKGSLPGRCLRLWYNPVVTWDGLVVPCCFDKNAEYVMGDLNRNSFREIWLGPEYSAFRNKVLKGRSETDICRNCTSGLRGVRT